MKGRDSIENKLNGADDILAKTLHLSSPKQTAQKLNEKASWKSDNSFYGALIAVKRLKAYLWTRFFPRL